MPHNWCLLKKFRTRLKIKRVFTLVLLALLTTVSILAPPPQLVFKTSASTIKPQSFIAQVDEASQLSSQGQELYEAGQFNDAITVWDLAAKVYAGQHNVDGITQTQIDIASALQAMGHYPQACNTLLRAFKIQMGCKQIVQSDSDSLNQQDALLKKLESQPNSLSKAIGFRSLGDTFQKLDRLDLSIKILDLSLKAASSLPSAQQESAALLSLGNAYQTLGNRERTEKNTLHSPQPVPWRCLYQPSLGAPKKFYQQAEAFYQTAAAKSVFPSTWVQAQVNRLIVLLQANATDDARELLPSIQLKLKQLPLNRTSVYAHLNLASSLTCLKQANTDGAPEWTEIAQAFAEASKLAQNLGDKRASSIALGNLAGLYAQQQQLSSATALTTQALALAKEADAADIEYQWQWQLGYLLKTQDDTIQAISAYTEAVKILQSLRSDLVAASRNLQISFTEAVEPVYRQLVDLLLQPNSNNQHNLQTARDVIEALQIAELENLLRCNLQATLPVPIDQMADSKTAVIYPIVLDNRIEVILSLPSQPLRHYSSTLPPKLNVENLLLRLSQNLQSPNNVGLDFLKLSQQVYDWLLKPAETQLKQSGVETLVFVLDAPLRQIPMAVLHDGKQYLIEKYAPVLSPSQKLLQLKSAGINQKVLTAGISQKIPNFPAPALPEVRNEISQISQVTDSTVVLNQDFTRHALQAKINEHPFSVVHLATHGQFSSQPNQTYIRAWDERIDINQLRVLLQSRESSLPAPIELLVLSACNTASGDKKAALGLAGVAVRAGARSTLASLWQVVDDSTAEFMVQFYKTLSSPNGSTSTKAKALQSAQLELLHKYNFPYYWAGYVLVGNWL